MKKKSNQKGPVRLCEKPLANGRKSLYLDINHAGRRKKEYLGLYLERDRTPEGRRRNGEVLALARETKLRRQRELYGRVCPLSGGRSGSGVLLQEYVRRLRDEQRDGCRAGWRIWNNLLRYLDDYCGEKTALADVTHGFVRGFREFLDKTPKRGKRGTAPGKNASRRLAPNTKHLYFSRFCTCVNRAVSEGLVRDNPLPRVKGFPQTEVPREYLTGDELRALVSTPCDCPVLKRAFLFSCLTGLRKCDIVKLVWDEVFPCGGFTRIVFRQKKTGGLEYLDINFQAEGYMGTRGGDGGLVFPGFPAHSTTLGKRLARWCRAAGITKKITFHSGRHTFAVMMFAIGGDIYTVSKLLGHRSLRTTQVYTKVLDGKKRALVARMPVIRMQAVM